MNLTSNNISHIVDNNFDGLESLKQLVLDWNNISSITSAAFHHLPNLEELNLAHNNLSTYEALEHLADCESISCLDLSHNRIDDPNIIDIFEKMPNLKVVNLMGNPMLSYPLFTLYSIEQLFVM